MSYYTLFIVKVCSEERTGSNFLSLSLFFFFRAAPAAHGGSQARGPIRAIAAAYTIATAMQDPSHVCNLHHCSGQCQILNPLSEARDRTHNLMALSQIHFHCATKGTPVFSLSFSRKTTPFVLVFPCSSPTYMENVF